MGSNPRVGAVSHRRLP